MHKLTEKQELFCYEYLTDFNAKQAAIRSGYSEGSAAVTGSRNLSHPAVSARLRQLIEERKARLSVSADYVLHRFLEIDRLDIADILDNEGNVLPITAWSEDWRRSVAAIDIQEMRSEGGMVKKIKLPDKLKNLEMIGKRVDVSAFRERAEQAAVDGKRLVINVTTKEGGKHVDTLQHSLIDGKE